MKEKHSVLHDLIFQSVHTDVDIKSITSLIKQHNTCIDWKEMYLLAYSHRVNSLVYNTFKHAGLLARIPKYYRTELYKKTYTQKIRYHFALKELDRLISVAHAEGLHPVLFKGLSIGLYYRNPVLRKVGDFDLLVPDNEIPSMIIVAKKLGYVFGEWAYDKPIIYPIIYNNEEINNRIDPANDFKHLPEMILPESRSKFFRAPLEIHRNVEPPSRAHDFDVEGAMNRAREVEIGNVKVLTLDPADAIWACALNLQRDAEYIVATLVGGDLYLSRYCDIHEILLQSPNSTCATLLNRARTPEARRACAHARRITDTFFPSVVPKDLLSELVAEYPDSGNRIFYGRTGGGSISEKEIGTWPRDIPDRIFDTKRALDILHLWWGLGKEVLNHGATKILKDRLGVSPPKELIN